MPLGNTTKSAARSKVYTHYTFAARPWGASRKGPASVDVSPRGRFTTWKKRDAAGTPNQRAPQAPSVCVRALASLVTDELAGRLADVRLSRPAALIPVT